MFNKPAPNLSQLLAGFYYTTFFLTFIFCPISFCAQHQ